MKGSVERTLNNGPPKAMLTSAKRFLWPLLQESFKPPICRPRRVNLLPVMTDTVTCPTSWIKIAAIIIRGFKLRETSSHIAISTAKIKVKRLFKNFILRQHLCFTWKIIFCRSLTIYRLGLKFICEKLCLYAVFCGLLI